MNGLVDFDTFKKVFFIIFPTKAKYRNRTLTPGTHNRPIEQGEGISHGKKKFHDPPPIYIAYNIIITELIYFDVE